MRRYIKRIFAALTVVMLLAANTVPVMAAGETGTGTLTLSNGQTAINNATFKAYRLMDITVADKGDNGKTYGYKINSDFAKFFDTNAKPVENQSKDVAAHEYLKNNVKNGSVETALKDFLTQNPDTKVAGTFNFRDASTASASLPFGYYAIMPDKKDGTHDPVFVPLTEAIKTAYFKELEPGTDKKVEEGKEQQDWGDASIGDTVKFTVNSIVPNMNGLQACKFILHDTMSKGLTFTEGSVKVSIGGNELLKTQFRVSGPETTQEGETKITVTIDNLKNLGETITANPGDTIVFTYSAVLNKDAVVGTDPVTNKAQIQYGNGAEGELEKTPEDTVNVKTYDLTITKRAETESGNVLAGAEFKLYKGDKATESLIKVVAVSTENGTYRVATNEDQDATETFVTPASGKITIKGLDKGTYTLEEVKAPNGYNKLNDTIEVNITATSADGTGTDVVVGGNNNLTVVNKEGTLLPETGGKGTVLFTIIGAVGVVVILLSFVSKKNKTDAK